MVCVLMCGINDIITLFYSLLQIQGYQMYIVFLTFYNFCTLKTLLKKKMLCVAVYQEPDHFYFPINSFREGEGSLFLFSFLEGGVNKKQKLIYILWNCLFSGETWQ